MLVWDRVSTKGWRQCFICMNAVPDRDELFEADSTSGKCLHGHKECIDAQEAFEEHTGGIWASVRMPETDDKNQTISFKKWIIKNHPACAVRLEWFEDAEIEFEMKGNEIWDLIKLQNSD